MKDSPSDRPGDERAATNDSLTDRRVPDGAEWEVVAQARFDPSRSSGLTTTIVSAVAEAEGVSPRHVKSPPLYEVVDTAALEAAFFGSGSPPRVQDTPGTTEFMYRSYRIVVRSDGWVLVTERHD